VCVEKARLCLCRRVKVESASRVGVERKEGFKIPETVQRV
jgi:hypothetical protein